MANAETNAAAIIRFQVAAINPENPVDALFADQLLATLVLNRVWFEVKFGGSTRQFYVHCTEDEFGALRKKIDPLWKRAEDATIAAHDHVSPHIFSKCHACQSNWATVGQAQAEVTA